MTQKSGLTARKARKARKVRKARGAWLGHKERISFVFIALRLGTCLVEVVKEETGGQGIATSTLQDAEKHNIENASNMYVIPESAAGGCPESRKNNTLLDTGSRPL